MATEPQEGGRRCKRPGRRHGSSRKRTHQGRAGLHLQGTPPWKQQQGSFLRYSSRKRTGGCILKATYYQFDIRYSSSSNLIDAGAPPWVQDNHRAVMLLPLRRLPLPLPLRSVFFRSGIAVAAG